MELINQKLIFLFLQNKSTLLIIVTSLQLEVELFTQCLSSSLYNIIKGMTLSCSFYFQFIRNFNSVIKDTHIH
jgi:hypothetical protein